MLTANVLSSGLSVSATARDDGGPLSSDADNYDVVLTDGSIPQKSISAFAVSSSGNTLGQANAQLSASAPQTSGATSTFGGNAVFSTLDSIHYNSSAGSNVNWSYTFESAGPVDIAFSYNITTDAWAADRPGNIVRPVVRAYGGSRSEEFYLPINSDTAGIEPETEVGAFQISLPQDEFSDSGIYTLSVVMGRTADVLTTRPDDVGLALSHSTVLNLNWAVVAHPRVPDLRIYGLEYDETLDALFFSHRAENYEGSYDVSLYRSADAEFDLGADLLVETKTYIGDGRPFGRLGSFSVSPEEHQQSGLPYYLVVIDPADVVSETDEDNNFAPLFQPFFVVESVHFGNTVASIKPDPGSGITSYDGPEYVDADHNRAPEKSFPVLYKANDQLTLQEVKFHFPTNEHSSAMFRGVGPETGVGAENFDFEEREGTRNGATWIVAAWNATSRFGNKVSKWDDFEITWEVSTDDGATWSPAGKSKNTVYVSAATPATSQLFHSVVDIAVRNTEGKTSLQESELIAGVWGDFDTTAGEYQLLSVDDRPLRYYRATGTQDGGVTTEEVLEKQIGDCQGMARLFLDALAVHGISGGSEVHIRSTGQGEYLMLREWSVNGPELPLFPGIDAFFKGKIYSDTGTPTDYNQYTISANGPAAIGPSIPKGIWSHHYLAKIGESVYDPSYGQAYTSIADYEEKAIKAFFYDAINGLRRTEQYFNFDYNGNGSLQDMMTVFGFLLRRNGPEIDLIPSPRLYPASQPPVPAVASVVRHPQPDATEERSHFPASPVAITGLPAIETGLKMKPHVAIASYESRSGWNYHYDTLSLESHDFLKAPRAVANTAAESKELAFEEIYDQEELSELVDFLDELSVHFQETSQCII